MIKRFNPDFSLSISHELAYMRETPEGGYVAHGDYATLFSELELVKADRDAQQKRADALAVENAAVKTMNDCLSEELRGYESDGAFEGPNMHLLWWKAKTPATDAALAAIRSNGVEQFIELKLKQLASMHLDTHAYGATAMSLRAQINELQAFVIKLREAK